MCAIKAGGASAALKSGSAGHPAGGAVCPRCGRVALLLPVDASSSRFAEVRAMNVNESGAFWAGVFVRFHPSRSEAALLMYSESLAGGDPTESRSALFRLKSAAGWKRKA